MDAMPDQLQIFTIGHSSHPLGSFVWLLRKHGIEALADIRSSPVPAGIHTSARKPTPVAITQHLSEVCVESLRAIQLVSAATASAPTDRELSCRTLSQLQP